MADKEKRGRHRREGGPAGAAGGGADGREAGRYEAALEGKSIPILTLDHKWQLLLGEDGGTEELRERGAELNALMEEQAKLRQQIKDIKRLKRKLLGEIMEVRSRMATDARAEKELDEHMRLIGECNEKIAAHEEALIGMPRRIYELNYALMLSTMELCYERMRENTEQIGKINEWLKKVRVELKKQLIYKQEGEIENYKIYSYMHQIFGPEVIDLFDMKYDPERVHPVETAGAEKGERLVK